MNKRQHDIEIFSENEFPYQFTVYADISDLYNWNYTMSSTWRITSVALILYNHVEYYVVNTLKIAVTVVLFLTI